MNEIPQVIESRSWLNIGWKVMAGWGILNIFFSIVTPLTSLFLSAKVFTYGIEDTKFVGMSWEQIVAMSPNMGLYMVLMMVSMCAIMMSSGLLILGISKYAYRRGERWAWRWLLVSNLIQILYYLLILFFYAKQGLYGLLGPTLSGANVGVTFIIIWAIVLYIGLWLPRKELQKSETS